MKTNENNAYVLQEKTGKKKIEIDLNNKILTQVNSRKYLGGIFDSKINFRSHINYVEEKCTKLIFSLSK
jgi:hypothetical protein